MNKENHQQIQKADQQAPIFSTAQNIMDIFARAMQSGEKIELVSFKKWQNLRIANIDPSIAEKHTSQDRKVDLKQSTD